MILPASVAHRLEALVYGERFVAYLRIDALHTLVEAGGHLETYGLDTLRLGEPALEQAFFLEGLIPLLETPYFLPSVELGNSRSADLHFHLEEDAIWVILLDATVEHHALQRMQQKAYDVTLVQEREALLNRRLEAANSALLATQRDLERSQAALVRVHERLQCELRDAALYVRSLLPAPMAEPFVAEWSFIPSTELGGDALGYHWIDPDHFALYVVDVCGHGVGPSLLSVAVLHVLQSASLPGIDFRDPTQVLTALNQTYQMQSNTDLYFTMWYGVYRPATRELKFGCAGHPPAVLVEAGSGRVELLKAKGLPVGLMPGVQYACESMIVPRDRWLYILSDGAFEVERPDGTMLGFNDFVSFITHLDAGDPVTDLLYKRLVDLHAQETLEDDFTIARFAF